MNSIEIICIESEAFYKLIDEVVQHVKKDLPQQSPDKWISADEAKKMLRIKGRTTLQKMRDEGRIRFTQPQPKVILYDADSIREYLEDFVYEPFELEKRKPGRPKNQF
jgi:hypothetical protein